MMTKTLSSTDKKFGHNQKVQAATTVVQSAATMHAL
jgi:hypothetical protein